MNLERHPAGEDILSRYRERTVTSAAHHRRAVEMLPGGDTRTATAYPPYPTYMDHGRGCRLWDVDGHEYLDFLNNYTALIHGHAHPPVTEALAEQAALGTALGSAAEIQYRHAELMLDRVSSLDRIRYCNSGTEATMFAVRAARLFSRRDVIIKIEGGYHGSHDLAEVSVTAPARPGGAAVELEPGAPRSVLADVRVVPFNDIRAVAEVLDREGDRVAGLLVEPMLGAAGQIPPRPGYLAALREITDRYGVLLIFDEVMSLRQALGGLQETAGVRPDITAMAKIIGGGLPVGAFGGRAEIMDRFNPGRADRVVHSGTFNGNNLTLRAGYAALAAYTAPEVERLAELGRVLREGLRHRLGRAGFRATITGMGSLSQIHWTVGPVQDARDAARGKVNIGPVAGLLHLELMNRGIYAAPRGMFVLSTPMGLDEINSLLRAFGEALEVVGPLIREVCPDLVGG